MNFKYAKLLQVQILFILVSGFICEASNTLENTLEVPEEKRSAPIDIPTRKGPTLITPDDWKNDLAYSIDSQYLMKSPIIRSKGKPAAQEESSDEEWPTD